MINYTNLIMHKAENASFKIFAKSCFCIGGGFIDRPTLLRNLLTKGFICQDALLVHFVYYEPTTSTFKK